MADTPAAAAPAASTPAPSAPAVDTGSSSGSDSTPDSTPDVGSEPEITADSFGWDDWDGSEDAFPEPVRPWAAKLNGHWTKQKTEAERLARAEADKIKGIYETLMEGQEDPRLAEYRTQIEEHGKSRQQLEQERDQYRTQAEAAQAQYTQYAEAQATRSAESFQKANSWIFESNELSQLGADLIESGFQAEDLPVLLRMPEPLLAKAKEIHKSLLSTGAKNVGSYAIKLARAEFKGPEPSPSALKVAGANGQVPSASIPTAPGPDLSYSDSKQLAAERALRLMKGR